MQLLNSDFKKGIVKLRITDPEDLWYLSNLIDPGDFVKSKTTRKIKIGKGDNAKVTKKTIIVKIEAETIDFGSSENTLRINGKIKEGPEDIPLGSYQSIVLDEKCEFVLEKVQWLQYQKEKLKESTEKKYNYLLCLLDREEALFALTKNFGYNILLTLKGDVPKKNQNIEIKKDFQQEIINALDIYNGRYNPEKIILASPAFYKDELFKKINLPDLKKKIVLTICSEISKNALDEVIKRPELTETLKSSRNRIETILIEDLLNEINRDNLAVYGENEVTNSINSGAISKLLITDEFIKKNKRNGDFFKIDKLMKQVESLKGEIHIISSVNESGKKLDGLGGIAALLRYKLNW